MKRLILLLFVIVACIGTSLAQTDFQKAVARWKGHGATAVATRITHKAAVAKDGVAKGTLTMTQPAKVLIDIDGGQDALLMEGNKFTMTTKGKKHTTSSQQNTQFATFQAVFESILSGGAKDLDGLSDLKIEKKGQQMVLTITPAAADKKQARRMLFSSFVLTIDTQTAALLSLRMNERAGNYTEYTFSDFKMK